MVGFHVGYCSTNENSKALQISEITPTMQYVPHYYVHIPPIEDPQHSNNLCSQKLYHIIVFKYPLLKTHNIHIICVLKNCPQHYYVQMPPFKTHNIEEIRVGLNCYQVLFTYQVRC